MNLEKGMRPPDRRGHRGLRPGGKSELKKGQKPITYFSAISANSAVNNNET